MSAPDMGMDILSAAGFSDAAAGDTTSAETPEVTTGGEGTETTTTTTTEAGAEGEVTEGESVVAGEEAEKVEGQEEGKAPESGKTPTPQSVHQAIKKLRDADPANAGVAKILKDSYERSRAYSQVFASVNEARDFKSAIEARGGLDGIQKLETFQQEVLNSDNLLFAGDPSTITNLVSDLKETGHIDALGKLATPFLSALQAEDPEAFKGVARSVMVQGLEANRFQPFIKDVNSRVAEASRQALSVAQSLEGILTIGKDGKVYATDATTPENLRALTTALKGLSGLLKSGSAENPGLAEQTQSLQTWFDEQSKASASSPKTAAEKLAPEMEKFNKERDAFNKQRTDFESQQVENQRNAIVSEADKGNIRMLGKSLTPFLKMAFFQGLGKPALSELGKDIRSALYNSLTNDKAYQSAMKGFWSQKTPNRDQILQYHNAKVESIADRIVRDTVQLRYPMYAKGGAAAGRVAAKTTAAGAGKQIGGAGTTPKTATYVAQRPKPEDMDMAAPNAELEMIAAGRARLKSTGKWVTWRKQ
jgi:hypothetical protein